MTGDEVTQARRALHGETRWTPELAYPPVVFVALTEEIRELRAALDALIPLVPGTGPAFEWIHWDRTPCSGCGRPMIWAITDRGLKMPLQAVPNPDGDQVAWLDPVEGFVRCRSRAGVEPDLENPVPPFFRFTVHWADCPKAPSFKRERR